MYVFQLYTGRKDVKFIMLLAGDFPLWSNLSLTTTYTQQPNLNIITTGCTTAIIWYVPKLNKNNNKDAFLSIPLGLSSGHLHSSVFHWIKPTAPPEDWTVVSGVPGPPPSILTMGEDTCQYQGQQQIHLKIHFEKISHAHLSVWTMHCLIIYWYIYIH